AELAYSTRDRRVLVVGQRDPGPGVPRAEQLFQVATEGVISRVTSKGTPRLQVVLQGTERAVIEELKHKDVLRARVRHAPMTGFGLSTRVEALERAVVELASRVLNA